MKEKKLYLFYLSCFFLILFLPLLNLPPWFTPPAWGKTIVFRSLMAILLFVVLAKYGLNLESIKQALSPKSKTFLPLWSLFAFFFAVFISTLFSFDVSHSLWGDPNRAGGFVNFSFYILFCLLGFLIIKKNDWKKLLDFSLIVGFIVSLIAVFQQFKILEHIFVPFGQRPSSTMGNPIILSIYLLFLFFLCFSFFILEKNKLKKGLYLFLLIFFFFTIIFITQTRAAFLGLTTGLVWFFIAYPVSEQARYGTGPKKMKLLKAGAVLFFILLFAVLFYLQNNPEIYRQWHPVIREPILRMTTIIKDFEAGVPRFSAWKISIEAFKERPILGYGPENFSIAFDKHYNPLFPQIKELWFDRAHNFLVDILITSGILGLISYLLFFFSIFWQLQKVKKESPVSPEGVVKPISTTPHGLQSAFLAYFVAAFFSIETFPVFLLFFLFSAYSLHLISEKKEYSFSQKNGVILIKQDMVKKLRKYRKLIIILLFLLLIWFIWNFNIKPFQINTKINIAQNLAAEENWQASFEILKQVSQEKSFLLPYVNSVYSRLLIKKAVISPEEKIILSEKIAQILDKNAKIQPYHAKNWYYLGQSLFILGKEKKDLELVKKARQSFEKALKLRPKDSLILLDAFLIDVAIKDFERAKEKSDYCLKTYPQLKECLWISTLINIYLNDIEKGKDFIEKAKEKGYPVNNEVSLNQLIEAFAENENYQEIAPIYENLLIINPSQTQYKTSLAFVYRELGEYEKAKELALEILKTNPELREIVEEFLKTLK